MIKEWKIQQKLLIGMSIISLAPFLLGIFFIKDKTESWLYDNNLEQSKALVKESARHFEERVLFRMGDITDILALDARFQRVDPNITSYIDVDPNKSLPDKNQSEIQIYEKFRSIAQIHPEISLLSYGTETGGYIEYPSFDPTQAYDPRLRGWYVDALQEETFKISEPYETKITKERVVGITRRVIDGEKIVGVLNLTIGLEQILEDFNKVHYGKSGEMLIVSPEGTIISSKEKTERMLPFDSLKIGSLEELKHKDQQTFEAYREDKEKIFTVHISPKTGWSYLLAIDKAEVLAESRTLSKALLGILLTVVLFTIVFLFLFAKYITKPIGVITTAIDKISRLDFSDYPTTTIEKYSGYQDEIGAIARAMSGMDHIKEINRQKEQMHYLATHDGLTGLPNRRSFMERMENNLANNHYGAVLLMDMDNFKRINDTKGHLFGDRVLKAITEKLKSLEREHIFISRFGGDEFLILLEKTKSDHETDELVQAIFQIFEQPLRVSSEQNGEELEIRLEFSMGVSLFPQDSQILDELLMNADMALYSAKNDGKNQVAFFDESMARSLRERVEIHQILEFALENDGYKMVYQPKVSLEKGEICGYEALVRLKDSGLSPGIFIAIAEESGLILPLGRKITELVIRQMARWRAEGMQLKTVSINFSALQLQDETYLDFLLTNLAMQDISAEYIQIEFTEHIFMDNMIMAIEFMNRLREHNISIAIDDFGAGYSSLNYIASLPVDILKFDCQLSMKLLSLSNLSAVDQLISFVHSLNLRIVAEGIEEMKDALRLKGAGCDMIQGYCFSKPVEAEEVPLLNNLHYDISQ